mmetsp:Transcript_38901/g.110107  ORF Transcript_38901/g.110107 Transcript_38901/m.110107 type:complete len:231 (+) Transcript_38901:767-1459(+)
MADSGLHHKAVEGSAEDAVVVVAVDEVGVGNGLLRLHAVNDALVQVGGGHLPGLGGKEDVGRVVDLGEMVEGVALLGVGQGVGAAVVGDGEVALLDVNVGGAVLPHGAELHQVAVRADFLDSVHDVDVADDVVVLGEDGVGAVNHGVGGAALLSEVHNVLWLEALEGLLQEVKVADVSNLQVNDLPADLLPALDALVDAGDGGEGVHPKLQVKLAAAEVVHDRDAVAAGR